MSRFTRISAYSLIVSFNIILGGMLSAAYAQSSGYPAKPVRAVVPFAPGSATDQVARAFTAKMGSCLVSLSSSRISLEQMACLVPTRLQRLRQMDTRY